MSTEPLAAEFAPWAWATTASDEQRRVQDERLAELRARGHDLGADVTVSALAAVDCDRLALGARTYVAAHAHLTGDVTLGDDCSVNVGTAVRGRVRTGRAVRVGARSSLLGFDHGFADVTTEVFRQPLTSTGIEVGDDVWIGAHVLVLDGVRIGDHAVVGAGAVVTRDVPDFALVVGNPARVVRDRRTGRAPVGAGDALAHDAEALGTAARRDAEALLARSWRDGRYRDAPDAAPTVRAHGDAVELADLLLGGAPPQLPADEHVARLRGAQDPVTGLVPGPAADGPAAPPSASAPATGLPEGDPAYHVLSTGYALDLLGSAFAHPVRAVTDLTPTTLLAGLDALPWSTRAWHAGAAVDTVGTALAWAARRGRGGDGDGGGGGDGAGLLEALVGWLALHRDPTTGLWGTDAAGLREPVNGTYRLVRGALEPWGLVLGDERPLVDTVLRRAAEVLAQDAPSACDTLDVVFPLHRAARTAPGYRAEEVREVARHLLAAAAARWHPGEGLAFAGGHAPGLQGTEMGLAVAWYAADLLGLADRLGYRPRGVHRPGPVPGLRGRR